MDGKAFVVSVSGTSGAGKSTVMEKLTALLPGAVRLHFDDYITLGNDIGEIRAWVDAGADVDAIETPLLARDLRRLASGEAIDVPGSGRRVEPAPIILLEEPFGRSRRELTPLVDLAAFIDAPADVALARRLLREIESQAHDPAQAIGAVGGQLRAFLAAGREAYQAASRAARDTADLVLDGTEDADALAIRLRDAIRRRSNKQV